jgi:dihydrofolate reductase
LSEEQQTLSPKPSFIPKSELCPRETTSTPKPSSVPQTKLCPQEASSNSKIELCPSLPAAIEHCADYQKIFICGGETIYRQALELANKIELTVIHKQYEGDTFFPEIDETCWAVSNTEGPSSVPNLLSPGDFDVFSFITYTRINNSGDRA